MNSEDITVIANQVDRTASPAGLPLLGRGHHADPSQGACLMEATAHLAGEPHTDRPSCVDPVLGALARVVNDAVSDQTRPGLLALAPEMIGTANAPDLARTLIALCCQRAQAVVLPIWAPRLRRDLRRAEASRSFTTRHAVRTVTLAAGSLALATHAERDQVLIELLADATRLAATSRAGRPALL